MSNKPNDVRVSRELLPCPFCGEVPIITKHHCEEMYSFMHRCEVLGPISRDFREDPLDHVKIWNTRAQPADQQGEPVGYTTHGMLAIAKDVDSPDSRFGARTNRSPRFCVPLYLHAQPDTAKVDERVKFEEFFNEAAKRLPLIKGKPHFVMLADST